MRDSSAEDNGTNLIISQLTSKFRRVRIVEFVVSISLGSIFLWLLTSLISIDIWLTMMIIVLIMLLFGYYFFSSKHYQNISNSNILEHINRQFPEYQESAQLLLEPAKNIIERLQKAKIEKLLANDYQQGRLNTVMPKFNFKLSISLIIISILIYFVGDKIQYLYHLFEASAVETQINSISTESEKQQKPVLTDIKIEIDPPAYTRLENSISNDLNFEVPEGSKVSWLLHFSNPEFNYTYTRSGKDVKVFKQQGTLFSVEDTIDHTSLYRISYSDQRINDDLNGIYSIAMLRDQPPKITIIEPNQTLIEIAKNGTSEFSLQANISDDYGISTVKILASVAKGSGEAVKFRDKEFRFEKMPENKNNYKRHWSLIDLGMEPGDEVYFSIVATDNKQPKSQTNKSSSIIVRWLDDDEVEMASEGIKISFVPEYFRSQRQIIIETEQLIADHKDLDQSVFQETSEDLGHSQSDLKQKYGQYLGDEFGEGADEQAGLADGYHGGESHSAGEASAGVNNKTDSDETHSGEEIDQDHEREVPEIGHEHHETDFSSPTAQTDLSGATELIQRFAHNHGTAEIGPMSKRDPKSWMKMAVNEMWQAELHLMLGEPAKALPFEYDAYKFLKLARQAERIYAKRLGFEPPPVTEERRLTGELMDILEYDLSYLDHVDNETDNALFKQTHLLLSDNKVFSERSLTEPNFTKSQVNHFKQLSARLIELSEERPVLVKYAAIAEQITISKSLMLDNCDQCITRLKNKLWQLLPLPVSLPNTAIKQHGFPIDIEKQYIEAQRKLKLLNEQGLSNE